MAFQQESKTWVKQSYKYFSHIAIVLKYKNSWSLYIDMFSIFKFIWRLIEGVNKTITMDLTLLPKILKIISMIQSKHILDVVLL